MRLLYAAILLELTCFALQEVPRGHGGWTLAGIAVLGAALPVLLAIARRPREAPRAGNVLAWAIGVLGAAQLGFAIMRAVNVKVIDIAATTVAALDALRQGANPYAAPIDQVAQNFHGYKYLPAMLLAYAPLSGLGLRGIVLTNLVLQAATAALLAAIAARRGGKIAGAAAAVFYLAIPFLAFQVFRTGANDLVPLVPVGCADHEGHLHRAQLHIVSVHREGASSHRIPRQGCTLRSTNGEKELP